MPQKPYLWKLMLSLILALSAVILLVPIHDLAQAQGPTGQLEIRKSATPADGTDFAFTIEGPDFPSGLSFMLDDEQLQTDGVFKNRPFVLATGTYTITEMLPPDWALTNISCDSGTWSQSGESLSVTISAGDDLTCTFTNEKLAQGGQLTIIKQATPADGTDFAFSLSQPFFLTQWGSNGSGNGQFGFPFGVAVDSAGNLYVADSSNHRIQKFNSDGGFITQWGSVGSGEGQFEFPRGVAVDSADNLYVADANNNRIQKFDRDGTFIAQWGSVGSGDGQFDGPRGVAVDSADNLYVVDRNNHHIQKFNSGGTFVAQWGSVGSGEGQFIFPEGVAVDSADNLYVADRNNHRIQKFNSDGTFVAQWGSEGSGEGQFNEPLGVAVDSEGNLYVSETGNDRIQQFDSDGTFVAQWGSVGSGDGQFDFPAGVAVDSADNLYVADANNNRIQKFGQGFSLDDEQFQTDGVFNNHPFVLPTGTYTITEMLPPDWALTNISCDSGTWSQSGESLSVTISEGDDLTCTFTNEKLAQGGQLTVIKQATPADGTDFEFTANGPGFPQFGDEGFSFILDDEPTQTDNISQTITFTNLPTGFYTVTEMYPPGWYGSSIQCDNPITVGCDNLDINENGTLAEFEMMAGHVYTLTFNTRKTLPNVQFETIANHVAENMGTLPLTVTLDIPDTLPISVTVHSSNGTATAGSDYTPIDETLVIPAGFTQTTVNLPILTDNLLELSETFTLTLSNPVNAVLGAANTAVITIIDTTPEEDLPVEAANLSNPATDTTPSNRNFWGQYGNETVSMTFTDLGPHQQAQISFDLFIIRSWDGNLVEIPSTAAKAEMVNPQRLATIGPDIWHVNVDGEELLRTTFSNWDADSGLDFDQAYPGAYPNSSFPARTNAGEIGSLAYNFGPVSDQDSVYRLSYTVNHTNSDLTINFTGEGLQDLADESWGLANVEVTIIAASAPMLNQDVYLPVVTK